MEHLSTGFIGDCTGSKIHADHITGLDTVTCLRAFEDRKPDIDRVAVENSGKGSSDDATDPTFLDGNGSVLTTASTTEILVSNHDIALFHLLYEILVDILHAVGGQLLVI